MPTIRIDVNHLGLGMELRELAFPSDLSLADLKKKLYPKTGTEPSSMLLTLLLENNGRRELLGDDETLEELGVENASRLEMIDTNNTSIANTLLSPEGEGKGESDGDGKYEAKAGDAGFAKFRKEASKPTADTEKAGADLLSLNQRVVSSSGSEGYVRFIGQCEALPAGWWVGVELDLPIGKNDGEVKGVRLFTCPEKHGAVMRPSGLKPAPMTGVGAEAKGEGEGEGEGKVAKEGKDGDDKDEI